MRASLPRPVGQAPCAPPHPTQTPPLCAPSPAPAPQDLDGGKLPLWTNMPAPEIGRNYWKLAPDATMRDLLLAVRADEACHIYVRAGGRGRGRRESALVPVVGMRRRAHSH